MTSFKFRLFQPSDETERQRQKWRKKTIIKRENQNNIRSIACVALKTDNWISSYVKYLTWTPCHWRWVAYVSTKTLCCSNETNLSTYERDTNITFKIGRVMRVKPIFLFNCIGEPEWLANVCVSFWIWYEYMQKNVHTWICFVLIFLVWRCDGIHLYHSKTWHSTIFHAFICITSFALYECGL